MTVFDQEVARAPSTSGYVGFVFGNSSGTSNDSFIIDNIRINSTDAPVANTYAISGKVLSESGAPISGAQVNVLNADNVVITRTATKLDGTKVVTETKKDGTSTTEAT